MQCYLKMVMIIVYRICAITGAYTILRWTACARKLQSKDIKDSMDEKDDRGTTKKARRPRIERKARATRVQRRAPG